MADDEQPHALTATRDGVVESAHHAHVVVAAPEGPPTAIAGDPGAEVYPRSALKPFQAAVVHRLLRDAGQRASTTQVAISCASHVGGDDHQIEAASMLAEAGLDEMALGCPPDWPQDDAVRSRVDAPDRLSHNCSGKHAAMLWAHTAAGGDPTTYLDLDSGLQRAVAAGLETILDHPPQGPGIDGCGAPAWRCGLDGLARGFARLIGGADADLVPIRDAMLRHPVLVGGIRTPDTAMMWADARVVAKRGAEGVMAAGFLHPSHGPLGVAVKVVDGADRAAAPLAATVLHALGAAAPTDVMRAPVRGGGQVHGLVAAAPWVALRTTEAFGLS